jgi:hypothetical protein|tara:strand:+ start:36158 stop:36592 length:435 start_codon:yes stop_codon:yes gene_type:complete
MNKTIDTFHFWSHEVHSTTINTLGSRVAVANIEPISGERLRELLEIQKTVGGAEEAVQGLNVCMAEEGFRMVSTIRDSPTIYEGRDDDMRGGTLWARGDGHTAASTEFVRCYSGIPFVCEVSDDRCEDGGRTGYLRVKGGRGLI